MFHHDKPFSGFSVDSLDQARKFYHDTLGVEIADTPMGMQKGIAHPGGGRGPRIAWFRDPAGNILSILEDPTRRGD